MQERTLHSHTGLYQYPAQWHQGNNTLVRCQAIFSLLVLGFILSGCAHQQSVNEPYPRWGEEYSIDHDGDNQPLVLRVLHPPGIAPACLLLVHGMNEHIGRYRDVAHFFARQFIVSGFDYYAHGLSNPVLRQADKALREGVDNVDVSQAYLAQTVLYDLDPMRKDLERALRKTVDLCNRGDEGEKPLFIISHSLGSLITASYLLNKSEKDDLLSHVKGVVLLAPGFAVSDPPGWRGWLQTPLIMLSFYTKTHFLNPQEEPLPLLLLNQLLSLITVPLLDGVFEVFSWPGLRYYFTPGPPGWVVQYLTDSEVEKERHRADGWIVRRSLLRYVKGIENEIVRFRRQMGEFSTPYYLIYSADDPITAAWGNEDFINATLKNNPDNAYLQLQDSPYHQHLFLTKARRNKVLKNLLQWLDRRLQSIRQDKAESQ